LFFVVSTILSNALSSSTTPNVIVLGLDGFFVNLVLQDYQVHDVVSSVVYYLSKSKSNVADDPSNKNKKCSEGKPQKKSYDNHTRKFQTK